MTQTSPLLRELLNAGLGQADAGCIDTAFSGEPDFQDGLEQIARVMALKETPSLTPPNGEPWKSIHIAMAASLANGVDYDTSWRDSIAQYSQALQFALTAICQIGMKNVLDQEAQKQKRKLKTTHFLKQLDTLGYKFRMNMTDDSIEVITQNGSERLSDGMAAVIYRKMVDSGFQGRDDIEACYVAAAYQDRYHPVRDYLTSLTYDGGTYIQDLAGYFQDQHNIFPLYLRKFLIGAVAKAFTGAQNAMLVLDGGQNLGKSTFSKWLCSAVPRYFVEAPIEPDNKDYLINSINKWIWEVKELGSTMRKADMEALKSFLTLEEITVRVPYGHYPIQKPALASYIGTVNNAGGILNDPTGSRRFHVCKLTAINWDYIKLDINKIWGEAVAAYLAKEPWALDPVERQQRDAINEDYQVDDVIEGLLKKYFSIDPNQSTWWIPTSDILKVLEDPYQGGLKGTSKGNSMQLAQTMAKLGLEKKKRPNNLNQWVNGYVGIRTFP